MQLQLHEKKKTLYSILQSKWSESKSNSYKILNNHCLILQAKMSPHNFTKNNNIVIIYYIIRGTPSPLREKGGGGKFARFRSETDNAIQTLKATWPCYLLSLIFNFLWFNYGSIYDVN